ncbi:MAG: HAD-IA family hydrolase [Alicyclobacillus sp.]|nr:HAD-IA family hydrolase [Alicyclobacillus sp.]
MELAEKKNLYYLRKVSNLTKADLLDGVEEALRKPREKGMKVALGSASKNANLVLNHLGIRDFFDYVVDPSGLRGKPAPDIFIAAAKGIDLEPAECIVFEDSVVGVQAAFAAGMQVVAIGNPRAFCTVCPDICIPSLSYFDFDSMAPREVTMVTTNGYRRE